MADRHFDIVNPLVLAVTARSVQATEGCAVRADAPVCTNGQTDVTCTGETYQGCETGQTDCANQPGQDDVCCAAWGPGPNDNIDHAYCYNSDAGWGGGSYCPSWWDIGNRPPLI